ncbi:hypothetical protein [Nonomuraea sp. NPDC050540]
MRRFVTMADGARLSTETTGRRAPVVLPHGGLGLLACWPAGPPAR